MEYIIRENEGIWRNRVDRNALRQSKIESTEYDKLHIFDVINKRQHTSRGSAQQFLLRMRKERSPWLCWLL